MVRGACHNHPNRAGVWLVTLDSGTRTMLCDQCHYRREALQDAANTLEARAADVGGAGLGNGILMAVAMLRESIRLT